MKACAIFMDHVAIRKIKNTFDSVHFKILIVAVEEINIVFFGSFSQCL